MDILIIVAELILLAIVLLSLKGLSSQILHLVSQRGWFQFGDNTVSKLRRKISRSLIWSGVLLSLVLVGINGFLIQRGENLKRYTLDVLNQTSPAALQTIAIGALKSFLLLLVVAFTIPIIRSTLQKLGDRVKSHPQLYLNSDEFDRVLKFTQMHARDFLWLLAIVGCSQFFPIPNSISQYLYLFLKVYIIVILGLLVLKAIGLIIDSLDAAGQRAVGSDTILRFYDRLDHLIPFLKRCLEYIIYISISTLLVQQFKTIAQFAELGSKLVQVIGIILLSRVLIEVAKLFIAEVLLKNPNLTDEQRKQRGTIVPLVQSILRYCIYFGAGIWILETLTIDPTPILAASGLLGLAVGLGSQNLVNDVVSGFFILFENYYLVGDFIEAGEVKGIVEAIELRTTRVRHPNGQLYIIRNGDIKQIVNYSKHYVYAIVTVRVAYDCDLDRVYNLLEEVGREFCQQESDVLEPTLVDGIEEFSEFAILIRTKTKVKPGQHLPIQRRLRKAIKSAFDRSGIEIPVGQYMLHLQDKGDRDITPRSPQ